MTTRTVMTAAALSAWVIALLAAVYVAFEQRGYRRSRAYRELADAEDSAGPVWRWWVLIGSVLLGAGLAAVLIIHR
jgi:hypothetical protein